MSGSSKIGSVNELFLTRIKPELVSWGLLRHPKPAASFGRNEHGYGYDFADVTNADDVKVAAFHIIRPTPSLWIKGYKTNMLGCCGNAPIILDNIRDVFTLTRTWSILHPLNIRFEFNKKINQTNKYCASQLIDDVLKELPKLRSYLYN